nr:alkaline phosphatase D family protein [Sorangium cellulosum]
MAGDAEHDRVVLWTKYTDPSKDTGQKKRFKVKITNLFTNETIFINLTKQLRSSSGFAHVDVDSPFLKPYTQYEYQFEYSNGQATAYSPSGKFWTAILPGTSPPVEVEFGGVSCTHQSNGSRRGARGRQKRTDENLKAASKRKLAFFVHAGDQVYCDSEAGGGPAINIAGYERKYQQAFSKKRGLNKLHHSFGMYTTWDDHEIFNEWQGRDTDNKKAKEHLGIRKGNKIKAIKIAGKQSFFNHQPIRKNRSASGHSTPLLGGHIPDCPYKPATSMPTSARSRDDQRLWSSFRWGNTLELFILDCRSERARNKHKYISKEQLNWLIHALHNSQATFKFILNSTPIGLFHRGKTGGRINNSNRWVASAFSVQRKKILSAAQCVGGVCWLSGDLHFGYCGGVTLDSSDFPGVCEVLMGPGGARKKQRISKRVKRIKIDINNIDKTKKKDDPNWLKPFVTDTNNYVIIKAIPNTNPPMIDIKFLAQRKNIRRGRLTTYEHVIHHAKFELRNRKWKLKHDINGIESAESP